MVTADLIRPIRRAADDPSKGKKLEARIQRLRASRKPFYLGIKDLNAILKWKLRGQYRRQKKLRLANTAAAVRVITGAAFAVRHKDRDYELELKVRLLSALRGVGVPVASAILAIAEPAKYGVIDFRVWRQIFGKKKTSFSVGDYARYMQELRRLAGELGWRVRDVDVTIWALDRRMNGGRD